MRDSTSQSQPYRLSATANDCNGSTTQKLPNDGATQDAERYHWDLRNRVDGYEAAGDDLTLDTLAGSTSGTADGMNDAELRPRIGGWPREFP